jgi:hypothetical protein
MVSLCSGVSSCDSFSLKRRIFKKFGKRKFVKVYTLKIPEILYGAILYCFVLLPQGYYNLELFRSHSRSFSIFFYAWNVSVELICHFCFLSSSILRADCLQIGGLLCLCLLEFISYLCTFSCSVIHSFN